MIEQRDQVPSEAESEAVRERIAADGPRLPLAASAPDEAAAREAVGELVDEQVRDRVLAQVKQGGLRLTVPGGFLSELVKAVLERSLQAELAEHLGYLATPFRIGAAAVTPRR